MKQRKRTRAKKVVYLFGTGATQAEMSLQGKAMRILMRDITYGILRKIETKKIKRLADLKNELAADHADIEHLITLYESTGIYKHEVIAKGLKRLFKEEIQERTRDMIPRLLTALIDMHKITGLNEKLQGILTLNYEDILERAIQKVEGAVDYSIEMNYRHSSLKGSRTGYPLLKLHGSFNWKNDLPITLTDEDKIRRLEDALWIPPGLEKRRERYPFSIIWGRAREVLDCDVLRVIGCSLSRNDWHLVSLLYTTQRLNVHKKEYDIELIDYLDEGKRIKDDYPYLRFRLISEIKEVRTYLLNSFSLHSISQKQLSEEINRLLGAKQNNILDIWLRAKGEDLKAQTPPISMTTETNIFANYMNEVIQ